MFDKYLIYKMMGLSQEAIKYLDEHEEDYNTAYKAWLAYNHIS